MRGYRTDFAFDGEHELDGGALVLVDGETILAVEPGSAPAPDGCEVVHLANATLLPGLIDAHVHLCADSGPRALEQLPELGREKLDEIISEAFRVNLRVGVTAVRDLGDIRWAAVDRRDTVAGEPHVVASGPPITIVGGHCANMGGAVPGSDDLRQAVRDRAEHGVDVVKIMTSGGLMTPGTEVTVPQFTLEELRVVVEEAHALDLPVTAHAHALSAVELAVEAGVDGLEHCSCFTAEGLRTPPELAARIAAMGIPVCPTLGRDRSVEPSGPILAVMQRFGLEWEDRLKQVAALYSAGVRLISGGDSGINPGKPHGVLPQSVIDLTAAGASPVEALASATALAATACGLADRTGRLRAGLAADLVLVDGNPMIDIEAIRAVRTVVARGQEIDLS